ncbi:uncharacterized protein LOC131327352 isoform X1 [Rhododendron vialii]|uniref:uncharacterized protein LOC131327352 isoform X1 n=1 Tax=Rhododendron vialii TaxID=182163 RepID=UPI00265FAC2F|nr:uncharacterized protein LOC131327352 isoform X1 [Rhododendron vialii]
MAMVAAEGELDLGVPSCLRLVSAFLAMEPAHVLISLARDCGGGSITDRVQRFIWDHCISKADGNFHVPYLKSVLKKIIVEVESHGFEVLDELYERIAFYMTSVKADDSAEENSRIFKCISFLFPDDCYELPSCPKARKLVVTLHCSLNMLEGDTGRRREWPGDEHFLTSLEARLLPGFVATLSLRCSVWPSSLLLSEFILSCPEIFSNKSCFEVGSGVGLVGICLAHVKASKVMLSDGDLSSLENMKLNLGLNQLSTGVDTLERSDDPNLVTCVHLPWESATGCELQDCMPDIILGADVIYDPLCLPHLVKVLAFLLSRGKSLSHLCNRSCNSILSRRVQINSATSSSGSDNLDKAMDDGLNVEYASKKGPLAFIASVIRNVDTFDRFRALADEANLSVEDVTEKFVLFNLLPYLQSYPRSSVRLFTLTHLSN